MATSKAYKQRIAASKAGIEKNARDIAAANPGASAADIQRLAQARHNIALDLNFCAELAGDPTGKAKRRRFYAAPDLQPLGAPVAAAETYATPAAARQYNPDRRYVLPVLRGSDGVARVSGPPVQPA